MRCLRHPAGNAALAAAIVAAALSDVVAAAPLVVPLTAADFQTQAGGMTATDSSDEVRGPVIKAPTTYTGDYAYIRSAPLAAGAGGVPAVTRRRAMTPSLPLRAFWGRERWPHGVRVMASWSAVRLQ